MIHIRRDFDPYWKCWCWAVFESKTSDRCLFRTTADFRTFLEVFKRHPIHNRITRGFR